jgi:hypothetical protein
MGDPLCSGRLTLTSTHFHSVPELADTNSDSKIERGNEEGATPLRGQARAPVIAETDEVNKVI